MDKKTEPFFPHRRMADGNFQSICLTCLRTIGVSDSDEELTKLDRAHKCKAVPYSARVPRPDRAGNRLDWPDAQE
ncbi:hypothetical protein HDF10_000199 [Edaphobacter lichenicola]|uniref:Uncharacterized protein n=1 Tax=Tunturiibacter lichenicola TaxID=2051959 RepID=A0A7W8J405_9BACT|nr:hypothetical protein [Edaphobacter lichenicola]